MTVRLTDTHGFGMDRQSLARAIGLLEADPDLLSQPSRDRATIALGIGSIKVEALVTWAVSSGLVVRCSGRCYMTPMARLVKQYDSQLQEFGTWWCTHYELASRHQPWRWYTHQFEKAEFDTGELDAALASHCSHVSRRSIQNARKALILTMNNTPLGDALGLAISVANNRYSRRPKHGLAGQAVGAFALIHWARESKRLTANIAELIQPFAPGKVFGFRLADLNELLDRIHEAYREEVLSVSRTAGLNSVTFGQEVRPLHLLETYYLEHLQGREPWEALQWSRTEGYSARLLAAEGGTEL